MPQLRHGRDVTGRNTVGAHGTARTKRERESARWPTALVRFDCGHSRSFPFPLPKHGQSLYCTGCEETVRVTNDQEE
jgi:hypothetical protein